MATTRPPGADIGDMDADVIWPRASIDYKLVVGDSLLSDSPDVAYCTLRYDFKPSSVKQQAPGAFNINQRTKAVHLQIPSSTGHTMYQGKYEPSKDEYDCVAIFDGSQFKLEIIGGHVKGLRHTRGAANLPLASASSTGAASPSTSPVLRSSTSPSPTKRMRMNNGTAEPTAMPLPVENDSDKDPATDLDFEAELEAALVEEDTQAAAMDVDAPQPQPTLTATPAPVAPTSRSAPSPQKRKTPASKTKPKAEPTAAAAAANVIAQVRRPNDRSTANHAANLTPASLSTAPLGNKSNTPPAQRVITPQASKPSSAEGPSTASRPAAPALAPVPRPSPPAPVPAPSSRPDPPAASKPGPPGPRPSAPAAPAPRPVAPVEATSNSSEHDDSSSSEEDEATARQPARPPAGVLPQTDLEREFLGGGTKFSDSDSDDDDDDDDVHKCSEDESDGVGIEYI